LERRQAEKEADRQETGWPVKEAGRRGSKHVRDRQEEEAGLETGQR
jgi:hypothetical protein